MFDSQDAMVRIDMSEYMEKHSVARLVGAPPGYVGYEEGGQLTEAVRRRPYSVILLDEIEKAHPDVFNILLQVMDDGRLTDGQGRTVDFRNTVLIMTSNIPGGRTGAEATFKPEFINRLDDIIEFDSLTEEQLRHIVDIQVGLLIARVAERGVSVELTDAARDQLGKLGYDPVYGARPLKRVIQRHLVDPLARGLLQGDFSGGDHVRVDVADGELTFSVAQPVSALCEHPLHVDVRADVDAVRGSAVLALLIDLQAPAAELRALDRDLLALDREEPARVVDPAHEPDRLAHLALVEVVRPHRLLRGEAAALEADAARRLGALGRERERQGRRARGQRDRVGRVAALRRRERERALAARLVGRLQDLRREVAGGVGLDRAVELAVEADVDERAGAEPVAAEVEPLAVDLVRGARGALRHRDVARLQRRQRGGLRRRGRQGQGGEHGAQQACRHA